MSVALEIIQWGFISLAAFRVFSLERRIDQLSTDLFRNRYVVREEVMQDIRTGELPVIRKQVLEEMGRPPRPAPHFNVQPIINRPYPVPVHPALNRPESPLAKAVN